MEVAPLGDQLVEASGYGDPAQEAWTYYGHGLGCMWEPPLIDKNCCDEDEVFEAGMVLVVECFLKDVSVGVAGFEDNFIVTADGTEVITPVANHWHE
jgi:Xaa-Pro aminopeptidase